MADPGGKIAKTTSHKKLPEGQQPFSGGKMSYGKKSSKKMSYGKKGY